MSASAYWLRIGGYLATEIAPHTPPTWETGADGGCLSASWAFTLTPRSQHQALKKGALVEVMCGPVCVWVGTLGEPDRTTWECHAAGLSALLRRTAALDTTLSSSRTIQYVLEQAILDGVPVANSTPVTGTAAGDPGNVVMIGTLLDNYAEQTGQRWGVSANREVYMRPDPTAPAWLAAPGSAAFGVSDEDVATRLFGRYDTGDGYATTPPVGTIERDDTPDLTPRGAMSEAAATAILSGMLQRRGDTSWVNGVTLDREQLTTMGGESAFLPAVTGGQLLRAHGLASSGLIQAPWLDVVIGKTKYTAGERTIYIEPVNASPIAGGLAGVIAA